MTDQSVVFDDDSDFPFKVSISLEPLLRMWREQMVPACSSMGQMFSALEEGLDQRPELLGLIEDTDSLREHREVLEGLMTVLFPAAFQDSYLAGVFKPFSLSCFYATPSFEKVLTDSRGRLTGRSPYGDGDMNHWKLLMAYLLILDRIYGLKMQIDHPMIKMFIDPETGLERYYRIEPDLRFTEVGTVGEPVKLSPDQLESIRDNVTDLELLSGLLPPERFVFQGFAVVQALEVTESQIVGDLERELLDQDTFLSEAGFAKINRLLAALFGRPNLVFSLAAIKGEDVLLLSPRDERPDNRSEVGGCIFSDSRHVPVSLFDGSIFARASEAGRTIRWADLADYPEPTHAEEHILEYGGRSIIVTPLVMGEKLLGTLDVADPEPGGLGPMAEMLLEHVAPMFARAVARALDRLDSQIESVVKEKCTALHPSVEWRFLEEAYLHLNRIHVGAESEMAPIIFKDVYPIYGSSDIRGSSQARNRAVQADLTEHLSLAGRVINLARDIRDWPLLDELGHLIDGHRERLAAGPTSGDEQSVVGFIHRDVETLFDRLAGLGPRVAEAVEGYHRAMDDNLGTVYHRRREFEDSVSRLNARLSAYIDAEGAAAQEVFPHYFEKHQTDGVDYVIYIGRAMAELGGFSHFFVKNLRLWQLMVACGLAWHTEQVKGETAVSLDTCHLVLVNDNPLSIRFRYDEKRFDVDGAYDVRHEIIKSRIDKAVVKKSGERLTQPGQVAVVYSSPAEAAEMSRHIDFLRSTGYLTGAVERLDLDDLPDVRGLKALRVAVDLESGAVSRRMERVAG